MIGIAQCIPRDFIRTSGVIGLLEASGVARWMFLVVLRVYVYGPPPILTKNQSKDVFVRFFKEFYI